MLADEPGIWLNLTSQDGAELALRGEVVAVEGTAEGAHIVVKLTHRCGHGTAIREWDVKESAREVVAAVTALERQALAMDRQIYGDLDEDPRLSQRERRARVQTARGALKGQVIPMGGGDFPPLSQFVPRIAFTHTADGIFEAPVPEGGLLVAFECIAAPDGATVRDLSVGTFENVFRHPGEHNASDYGSRTLTASEEGAPGSLAAHPVVEPFGVVKVWCSSPAARLIVYVSPGQQPERDWEAYVG